MKSGEGSLLPWPERQIKTDLAQDRAQPLHAEIQHQPAFELVQRGARYAGGFGELRLGALLLKPCSPQAKADFL